MNECLILMRANTKYITKAIVDSCDLEKGRLIVTCDKQDGMELVLTRDHGQLLEEGYINEPYNKEDYQINIRLKVNDESYKIYGAKIKKILMQYDCELTFGFNVYHKLKTVHS